MPRSKNAPTPALDDIVAAAPPAKAPTKAETVLGLLKRLEGATLSELVESTDWQPHTTRAVLSGLRKKGHAIERRKRGDLSCYHLPQADA